MHQFPSGFYNILNNKVTTENSFANFHFEAVELWTQSFPDNLIHSMGGLLSVIPGEGTYTNLGDTDGFFSSYLQQPSDTQASLFRKSASQFLSMISFGAVPLNIFTYKIGRSNDGPVLGFLTNTVSESNI